MLNQRTGPWCEPVYLHSSGFDASILHDDDGRKYIVSLDWETREGYENPIVTSNPIESNERHDPDHLKPKYFNPDVVLQKAGHGSYVEPQLGEVYLAPLCSRPFRPELRCTLGRETAIQKMKWTEDGWLRMADGSNIAKEYCEESALSEYKAERDMSD